MTSLAEQVKQHGHVVVGLLKAGTFADTIYKLTNSVDQIPKETLKESFKCFLKSFELYVGTKDPKTIDSKTAIQDFLREDSGLYKGNEIILHCLCAVAVKYSVGGTRIQADTNWYISGGELCWVADFTVWGPFW